MISVLRLAESSGKHFYLVESRLPDGKLKYTRSVKFRCNARGFEDLDARTRALRFAVTTDTLCAFRAFLFNDADRAASTGKVEGSVHPPERPDTFLVLGSPQDGIKRRVRSYICKRQNRLTGLRFAVVMSRLESGHLRSVSFQDHSLVGGGLEVDEALNKALMFLRGVAFESWRKQAVHELTSRDRETGGQRRERALKHISAFVEIEGGEKVDCACGRNRSRGLMVACEHCEAWEHAECQGFRSDKQIPKDYICSACVRAEREDVVVIRLDEQGECASLQLEDIWTDARIRDREADEAVCYVCGCEDSQDFEALIHPVTEHVCDGGLAWAHPSCMTAAQQFSYKVWARQALAAGVCQICGDKFSTSPAMNGERYSLSGLTVPQSYKASSKGSTSPSQFSQNRSSRRSTKADQSSRGVKRLRSALTNGGTVVKGEMVEKRVARQIKEEEIEVHSVHSAEKTELVSPDSTKCDQTGGTLLGRRFSDATVIVPIKKRKFQMLEITRSPSPPVRTPTPQRFNSSSGREEDGEAGLFVKEETGQSSKDTEMAEASDHDPLSILATTGFSLTKVLHNNHEDLSHIVLSTESPYEQETLPSIHPDMDATTTLKLVSGKGSGLKDKAHDTALHRRAATGMPGRLLWAVDELVSAAAGEAVESMDKTVEDEHAMSQSLIVSEDVLEQADTGKNLSQGGVLSLSVKSSKLVCGFSHFHDNYEHAFKQSLLTGCKLSEDKGEYSNMDSFDEVLADKRSALKIGSTVRIQERQDVFNVETQCATGTLHETEVCLNNENRQRHGPPSGASSGSDILEKDRQSNQVSKVEAKESVVLGSTSQSQGRDDRRHWDLNMDMEEWERPSEEDTDAFSPGISGSVSTSNPVNDRSASWGNKSLPGGKDIGINFAAYDGSSLVELSIPEQGNTDPVQVLEEGSSPLYIVRAESCGTQSAAESKKCSFVSKVSNDKVDLDLLDSPVVEESDPVAGRLAAVASSLAALTGQHSKADRFEDRGNSEWTSDLDQVHQEAEHAEEGREQGNDDGGACDLELPKDVNKNEKALEIGIGEVDGKEVVTVTEMKHMEEVEGLDVNSEHLNYEEEFKKGEEHNLTDSAVDHTSRIQVGPGTSDNNSDAEDCSAAVEFSREALKFGVAVTGPQNSSPTAEKASDEKFDTSEPNDNYGVEFVEYDASDEDDESVSVCDMDRDSGKLPEKLNDNINKEDFRGVRSPQQWDGDAGDEIEAEHVDYDDSDSRDGEELGLEVDDRLDCDWREDQAVVQSEVVEVKMIGNSDLGSGFSDSIAELTGSGHMDAEDNKEQGIDNEINELTIVMDEMQTQRTISHTSEDLDCSRKDVKETSQPGMHSINVIVQPPRELEESKSGNMSEAIASGKDGHNHDVREALSTLPVSVKRSEVQGRTKSSGWDQLPEGFDKAEDALRAAKENPVRCGRGTLWVSANGRGASMSPRGGPASTRFGRAMSMRMDGPGDRVCSEDMWIREEHQRGLRIDDNVDISPRLASPREIGRGRLRGRGGAPVVRGRGRMDSWIESSTGPPTPWGPNRHPSPPGRYGDGVGFGPHGPTNAAAVAAAKVESSGFVVAPDGTVTKAGVASRGPPRPFQGGRTGRGAVFNMGRGGPGMQMGGVGMHMGLRVGMPMGRGGMGMGPGMGMNMGLGLQMGVGPGMGMGLPGRGGPGGRGMLDRFSGPSYGHSAGGQMMEGSSSRRGGSHTDNADGWSRKDDPSSSPGRHQSSSARRSRSHTHSRSRSRTRSPRLQTPPKPAISSGSGGLDLGRSIRKRSLTPVTYRSEAKLEKPESPPARKSVPAPPKLPLPPPPPRGQRSPPAGLKRLGDTKREGDRDRDRDRSRDRERDRERERSSTRTRTPPRRTSPHVVHGSALMDERDRQLLAGIRHVSPVGGRHRSTEMSVSSAVGSGRDSPHPSSSARTGEGTGDARRAAGDDLADGSRLHGGKRDDSGIKGDQRGGKDTSRGDRERRNETSSRRVGRAREDDRRDGNKSSYVSSRDGRSNVSLKYSRDGDDDVAPRRRRPSP